MLILQAQRLALLPALWDTIQALQARVPALVSIHHLSIKTPFSGGFSRFLGFSHLLFALPPEFFLGVNLALG